MRDKGAYAGVKGEAKKKPRVNISLYLWALANAAAIYCYSLCEKKNKKRFVCFGTKYGYRKLAEM